MTKMTKTTLLCAAAALCFSTPAFAQYGSGSSYEKPPASTQQTLDREARKRAKAEAKRAKKLAKKKAKMEQAEKEKAMMAKEDAMMVKGDAMMKKDDHMMAKEDVMMKKDDHMMAKGDVMMKKGDSMMKEDAMIKTSTPSKPVNCPAGTTAQFDGTCMITGNYVPRS